MENIKFNTFQTKTITFDGSEFSCISNEIPLKLIPHLEYANETLCFLESAISAGGRGEYSILAFGSHCTISGTSILTKVENILGEIAHIKDENLPMVGCLYGYIPYTSIKEFEPSVRCKTSNILPEGMMFLPKNLIIIENSTHNVYISSIYTESDNIAEIYDLIHKLTKEPNPPFLEQNSYIPDGHLHENGFTSQTSKEEYQNIVKKCIEYIKKGDIFQIVPSMNFYKPFCKHPLSFYQKLKLINPSPYMFYFSSVHSNERFAIIGASPEILINCKNNEVTLRPLAGTIRRGINEEEDIENEKALLSDQKEIAEHLMLLDLGRNDVGKVADSVYVEKQMQIERYSHVMHISSTVKGKRKPECSMIDILKSGLPAGTLSGAPKIRAMQIISALEPTPRDFYAGTIGYVSQSILQTCIILRSALIKNGILYTQAGAGVVYDSNPENEYNECIQKLAAITKASQE